MLPPDALPAFLLGWAQQRLRSPPTRRPEEGRALGPGHLSGPCLSGPVSRLPVSSPQLPAIGPRVEPLLSAAWDRRGARLSRGHPPLPPRELRPGPASGPAGGGEPPVQARPGLRRGPCARPLGSSPGWRGGPVPLPPPWREWPATPRDPQGPSRPQDRRDAVLPSGRRLPDDP